MAQLSKNQWGGRAKFWRQLSADDPVGPLAEWAYFSPRSMRGLSESELQLAPEDVQRETALLWFLSNYKPYELGPGPYFGFAQAKVQRGGVNSAPISTQPTGGTPFSDGSRFSDGSGFARPPSQGPEIVGFGQGSFAPSRFSASEVIEGEFGETVRDNVRRELVSSLGGDWMRSWDEKSQLNEVGVPRVPDSDLSSAILTRLEQLEEAVGTLTRPTYGTMGHNSAEAHVPLTAQDRTDFNAAIDLVRMSVLANQQMEALREAAKVEQRLAAKIRPWVLTKADLFVTEAVKSLGKETGKIVSTAIYSVAAMGITREVIILIEHWARIPGP